MTEVFSSFPSEQANLSPEDFFSLVLGNLQFVAFDEFL